MLAEQAGLAAYVYSQNSARLWRLSEQIEAGMVGANTTSYVTNQLNQFISKYSQTVCDGIIMPKYCIIDMFYWNYE